MYSEEMIERVKKIEKMKEKRMTLIEIKEKLQ
jgi:DNA-binding transcriptional MerR regulator